LPTGGRASASLPPLPTTGLSGKTIAMIALGVVVAGALLVLLLR
jgi:LPXTG-motif cell wall-anchored protein